MSNDSPTPLPEIGITAGDAQAIIDTAVASAEPHPLDEDTRFHSVIIPAGAQQQVVDIERLREFDLPRPRRKNGTVRVHDSNSFVEYLGKHGLPETEVWADVTRQQLVGVVNAHEAVRDSETHRNAIVADGGAGWADHRATLELRPTPAWEAWARLDRKLVDQNSFAEHLEDRLVDVINPTGADMLELAQTFQATIGVSFESSKQLSSGERQLEYKENVESRAGRRGQMQIPKDFQLGLIPFEGAEAYKVTARFRYRITDGTLRIGYLLDRPEDVLRTAFMDIVAAVEQQITAPMFRGVPSEPIRPTVT